MHSSVYERLDGIYCREKWRGWREDRIEKYVSFKKGIDFTSILKNLATRYDTISYKTLFSASVFMWQPPLSSKRCWICFIGIMKCLAINGLYQMQIFPWISGLKSYLHICVKRTCRYPVIRLSLLGKLSWAYRAHPYISDPVEKLSEAISSYLTM